MRAVHVRFPASEPHSRGPEHNPLRRAFMETARRCRVGGPGATGRYAISVLRRSRFHSCGVRFLPHLHLPSAGRGVPDARMPFGMGRIRCDNRIRRIPTACFRRSLRIPGSPARFREAVTDAPCGRWDISTVLSARRRAARTGPSTVGLQPVHSSEDPHPRRPLREAIRAAGGNIIFVCGPSGRGIPGTCTAWHRRGPAAPQAGVRANAVTDTDGCPARPCATVPMRSASLGRGSGSSNPTAR